MASSDVAIWDNLPLVLWWPWAVVVINLLVIQYSKYHDEMRRFNIILHHPFIVIFFFKRAAPADSVFLCVFCLCWVFVVSPSSSLDVPPALPCHTWGMQMADLAKREQMLSEMLGCSLLHQSTLPPCPLLLILCSLGLTVQQLLPPLGGLIKTTLGYWKQKSNSLYFTSQNTVCWKFR